MSLQIADASPQAVELDSGKESAQRWLLEITTNGSVHGGSFRASDQGRIVQVPDTYILGKLAELEAK